MRPVLRALTTFVASLIGLSVALTLGVVPQASAAGSGHIIGRVTGADGSGLPGVSVTVYNKSAYSSTWTTDATGQYDADGLPAGTYRVGFSSPGDYINEFWDDAATIETAKDVVVAEGGSVSGINAQLAPASHITGTVTGPGGAAVQGVYVSAYQKAPGTTYWSPVNGSTSTDAAGHYDLRGLKSGTYRVGFFSSDHITEYWDNAATAETARDIVVTQGDTVSGKDARLATPSHITGTVTGATGTGLANVQVAVYQKTQTYNWWSQMRSVETNASGEYDLGGLAAGAYRLGFTDSSGTHLAEYFDNATTVETAVDIAVGESSTVSQRNARLALASHITGKVTDAKAAALQNIRVTAYQWVPGMNYWGAVGPGVATDATGAYDLGGLRAGTYRLGFQDPSGDHFGEYFDNVATLEAATGVTVGEGVTVSGKDAQLASPSHITGKVTGADGAGLAQVRVIAYSKDVRLLGHLRHGDGRDHRRDRQLRPRRAAGGQVPAGVPGSLG